MGKAVHAIENKHDAVFNGVCKLKDNVMFKKRAGVFYRVLKQLEQDTMSSSVSRRKVQNTCEI